MPNGHSAMEPATIRRLMAKRSVRAYLEQRRSERAAQGLRFDVAIALVLARRTNSNWGWLDQDRSTHV